MRLSRLLEGTPSRVLHGHIDRTVADLADHADCVCPGGAYLARSGSTTDGRRFIRHAIERGATIVIGDVSSAEASTAPDVTWVRMADIDTRSIGRLAQRFFGEPARRLQLVGITGTNGKTTTAWILRHLLDHAGHRCGMLGTVANHDGVAATPATLTTPGSIDLARWLAAMVSQDCRAAVLEVSSHALDQGRADALAFAVAIFTNLTGDHLDYHRTMDEYVAAKAHLFGLLQPNGTAVVNVDDARMADLAQRFPGRRLACRLGLPGEDLEASCAADIGATDVNGTEAIFRGPWGRFAARLPLPGRHNVANALLATAAAACLGLKADVLARGLATVPAVPGRLERVGTPATADAPVVLVDYAHTHDALENALRTVRLLTRGRVIVVFGCGGDRDATKRPKMAEVACRLADRIVLTNDNPRTEDPGRILRDLRHGVPEDAAPRVVERSDRRAAIVQAINEARGGDLVLIAGKGHEDYQIIGHQRHGFDDRREAASALQSRCTNRKDDA